MNLLKRSQCIGKKSANLAMDPGRNLALPVLSATHARVMASRKMPFSITKQFAKLVMGTAALFSISVELVREKVFLSRRKKLKLGWKSLSRKAKR